MVNYADLIFSLFADDSTATHSDFILKDLLDKLKSEFAKVLEWLKTNKLIINLQKTYLMVFTNKERPETISLNINGSIIQERTESKFLGVILDNKLTWHAHVKHISSKISKSIAIVRMLKDTFPKHILKILYIILVYTIKRM